MSRSTVAGIRLAKMRILLFLGNANPYPQAAWTRISFFAEYFKSKGYKVDVIGTFSPKTLSKAGARFWRGFRILNVCPTFSTKNFLSPFFEWFSSIFTLIILFPLLDPNLVVISVPTVHLLTAIGAYMGAKTSRAKIIFDFRDEWEDNAINKAKGKIFEVGSRALKLIMSSLYAKSDLVLAVTPNYINGLKARGINKIKIIPNGADLIVFNPSDKKLMRSKLGLPSDAFIIVYSGGISTCPGGSYRLDIVLKALCLLKKAYNIILVLVGKGPDLLYVSKFAKENGLEGKVVYLGVKNDKKKLAEILSVADVGVVPYDDDPRLKNTLPAKFFEYCACNLPVIATAYRDSILANLICANGIGLICKPLNVKELAKAIEKLHEDKIFRERAGKNARLIIEQNFDRNKIAEEFLNIIVDLLKVK